MELTYISHQGSACSFDNLKISYIQKHLIVLAKYVDLKEMTLVDFDFTKEFVWGETNQTRHYVVFQNSKFLGNSLNFEDVIKNQNITETIKTIPISLFDWQNKKLTIEEDGNE